MNEAQKFLGWVDGHVARSREHPEYVLRTYDHVGAWAEFEDDWTTTEGRWTKSIGTAWSFDDGSFLISLHTEGLTEYQEDTEPETMWFEAERAEKTVTYYRAKAVS